MNWLQRIVTSVAPKSAAASIESESRAWMVRCDNCGHEQSVWDRGGVRWKAKGSPRFLGVCNSCHEKRWHTMYRRSDQL
ncbi:MAG TPA: hypothetical protein VMM84_07415 [Pyrinomonadaceae bacterium]|nr:hypothetical protein [Pyrinomonadaceae bacterium]